MAFILIKVDWYGTVTNKNEITNIQKGEGCPQSYF
jgi:hypothetical protein